MLDGMSINLIIEHTFNFLMRASQQTRLHYIDLKAAFDTIDIPIMLSKLEHYGIRNNSLKLFESYLTNRTQYIKYGYIESTLLEILCGVPQGSVLGPLLFILYINDLSECSNLIPNLYADDAAFIASAKNVKALESTMNFEVSYIHELSLIHISEPTRH